MAHPVSFDDDNKNDGGNAITQPALHIEVNARRLTAHEWIERAKWLADQHHMRGALRCISIDPHSGELLYAAPRHTQLGYHYLRLCVPECRISCDCEAAQHHKPCCHIGAAIHLLEAILRSLTPEACASQRRYERMCDDLPAS